MTNKMLENMDEMTDRYRGSYIARMNSKKALIPLRVDKFSRREEGSIVILDDKGREYTEDEVVLDRPRLGAFNVGIEVVYIETSPKRQWRRGLVPRDLQIYKRFRKEVREVMHQGSSMHEINEAIFNPNHLDVKDALKEVEDSKALARAFSPKFYFGIKSGYKNILVFYKRWIVGYVVKEGEGKSNDSKVMLKSHHLYEELSRFINVEKIG